MGVALSPGLMYLSQVGRLLCLHMQTVAAGGGGRGGVGRLLQKSSRGTFHTFFFFFCPPPTEMGQLCIPVNPQRRQETCVWPWQRTSSLDDFIQHLNIRAILYSTVQLLYFCSYSYL